MKGPIKRTLNGRARFRRPGATPRTNAPGPGAAVPGRDLRPHGGRRGPVPPVPAGEAGQRRVKNKLCALSRLGGAGEAPHRRAGGGAVQGHLRL